MSLASDGPGLSGGRECKVDVGLGVGRGKYLTIERVHEHSPRAQLRVESLHLGFVLDNNMKKRGKPAHKVGRAVAAHDFLQPVPQSGADRCQPFGDALPQENLGRGQGRDHRRDLVLVSAHQTGAIAGLEDIFTPDNGGQTVAVGQALADRREIRHDPGLRLYAADAIAEAGNDFVEDQEHPLRLSDLLHFPQVIVVKKSRLWREDDTRDVVAVAAELLFKQVQVVAEIEMYGIREPEAGKNLEMPVVPAVVAAREHLGFPCKDPGQPSSHRNPCGKKARARRRERWKRAAPPA